MYKVTSFKTCPQQNKIEVQVTCLNSEQKVDEFHFKIAVVPDKSIEWANQLMKRMGLVIKQKKKLTYKSQ